MDWLDWIEPAVAIASAVLGAIFVWRQWRARRLARAAPALHAAVTAVERTDKGGRSPWHVETLYDVPGHGVLRHYKVFDKEGPALLFARLHREGSMHWVVPNEVEAGQVFLMEEIHGRGDRILLALLVVAAGLAAWVVYAIAMEYWEP